MIVDNCPAHPKVQGLKAIKLIFLPPNTTSKTQPMDQGVIQNLKLHYRKLVILQQLMPMTAQQNQPSSASSMPYVYWAELGQSQRENHKQLLSSC